MAGRRWRARPPRLGTRTPVVRRRSSLRCRTPRARRAAPRRRRSASHVSVDRRHEVVPCYGGATHDRREAPAALHHDAVVHEGGAHGRIGDRRREQRVGHEPRGAPVGQRHRYVAVGGRPSAAEPGRRRERGLLRGHGWRRTCARIGCRRAQHGDRERGGSNHDREEQATDDGARALGCCRPAERWKHAQGDHVRAVAAFEPRPRRRVQRLVHQHAPPRGARHPRDHRGASLQGQRRRAAARRCARVLRGLRARRRRPRTRSCLHSPSGSPTAACT